MEAYIARQYFESQPEPKAIRSFIYFQYALRCIAQPQDIANVALLLTSDESSFVTSACTVADSGLTSRCY